MTCCSLSPNSSSSSHPDSMASEQGGGIPSSCLRTLLSTAPRNLDGTARRFVGLCFDCGGDGAQTFPPAGVNSGIDAGSNRRGISGGPSVGLALGERTVSCGGKEPGEAVRGSSTTVRSGRFRKSTVLARIRCRDLAYNEARSEDEGVSSKMFGAEADVDTTVAKRPGCLRSGTKISCRG